MLVRIPALVALVLLIAPAQADAANVPVPKDLPQYQLAIRIDPDEELVTFRQTVTWTNRHARSTDVLVLQFYPHYRIAKDEVLLLAKTLELLRLNPSYAIDRQGRVGRIEKVTLAVTPRDGPERKLPHHFREDNQTALEVELPRAVATGETASITIEGTIRLREKQGRWGTWNGVTFLVNALPVVAYYDERGWHDVPFVPWHQPFWNEAGVYTATITLPDDQVLACSADIEAEQDQGGGWKRVMLRPFFGRDFCLVCSHRFREHTATTRDADGREIRLRCLALAHHDYYAKEVLDYVGAAITEFSRTFGAFPYDHFTVAESYFGWNGNECAGMILLDERVFDLPKLARGYVEYLASHETCHQWWYNQIGTNGYAETWLDEGAATYFTHRMLDRKVGQNNPFLKWPSRAAWLPNIRRDNYRYASLQGSIRRDNVPPAAGKLPQFGHLANLFSGAYDRGSKVYALIEARLGVEFVPFMQELVRKYSFRVLTANQLKAELIEFTGPASAKHWNDLFDRWVTNDGVTDWDLVTVRFAEGGPRERGKGVRVEVVAHQLREYDEPTTIGFQFADGDGFPVRIPINPNATRQDDPGDGIEVEPLGNGRVLLRATLPAKPTQIEIDPDHVLLDANRANNAWYRLPRVKLVPIYSLLYDTDLTNDYDRWNATAGPWIWGPTYADPWYTRSTLLGFRASAYRTQAFNGGAYLAIRPEYRDLVVGVDGLLDHWPFPRTQVGFNYEQRLAGPWGDTDGEETAARAAVFGRYVLRYGSSTYLPPMSYIEAFTTYQDNFLPISRQFAPGSVRPDWTLLGGLHYRLNLYTPYWDPERGFWADVVWATGVADLGPNVGTHQLRGELAMARKLPDGLGYFSNVKLAGRVAVQGAFPDRGLFFALGGSTLFRGFDLQERQGSFLWAASAEARLPLFQDVRWNFADDLIGGRNLTLATFYDVGNIYANGRSVGGAAHALGVGLRLDLAIFSFIERATVRFDVGKTINAATPFQFWFGVQHPF